MASWPIHLVVAKKVSEMLRVDNELFAYGNLIPDVDSASNISRRDAHFYTGIPFMNVPCEKKINIDAFLNTYKDKLNNHLILGYYSHLLTDNFFNEYIYSKCWVLNEKGMVIGIKLNNGKVINVNPNDDNIRKEYKHADLELYGKYLLLDYDVPSFLDKAKIISKCADLVPNFLNESLVNKRINYLGSTFIKNTRLSISEKLFKHKYKLLTKDEIDKLLNDCIDYVVCEIKKLNVL